MKTIALVIQGVFLCVFAAINSLYAQVGIGPTPGTIDGSASLDVKSGPYTSGNAYRGLLVPSITSTQRDQIQSPAVGLLIFNSTTKQIEVNTGTVASPTWTPGGAVMTTGSNTAWSLTGNSGTISGTNFLGTRDNVPLNFRVNNQNAGRIDQISYNTALGHLALNSANTGQGNTAIGFQALSSNTSSNYNTASGFQTLFKNTTGNYNTATGTVALQANTSGNYNTASGYKALYSNLDGSGNTAIGSVTLQDNTNGHDNTALGQVALQANTSGNYNTATGAGALQHNTSGYANTGLGHNAVAANTVGYANVGIGEDALVSNLDGHDNVAVGNSSLLSNTNGQSNMATGTLAMNANTTGQGNTAAGTIALRYNKTGSSNSALGYNAGPTSANPNLNNTTAIGANAVVSASNQIVLGDNSITSLRCNVQTISSLSDKRIKEDIQANVPGLNFITKLIPVTYHINKVKEAKLVGYSLVNVKEDSILHSGFIAQDVEAAAKAVGYDFEGVRKQEGADYYTLGYTLFVIPLVQSVKDLHTEIEDLKARLKESNEAYSQLSAQVKQLQGLMGMANSAPPRVSKRM
ncbi:tail fiber domain-containing protein [Spirosoma sp. KNUC1025]|uniref:tail fiber domain-containing protein n=1 Tax=Spirosoma sp. KNUC1025 TaxID=2894082 RepID=UPI003863A57D|nr:tail fiber domain-containing protein [Spirosoma sp. KNUC1025]